MLYIVRFYIMTIGTTTTVVGLLNSMIGGSMLIIPVDGKDAGYLSWTIRCILIGVITGYTAYLLVGHLGKAKNIKYLVLAHFGQDRKYTTVYNCTIWFSFLSAMLLYFSLFCVQIEGLFGKSQYMGQIIFLILVLWSIGLRQFDLSEVALASGISSIIGFLAFITWALDTAPPGQNFITAFQPKPQAITLAFLNCYTTHDFMIQLITNNPKRKDYPMIIVLLYFFGILAFLYTSCGSFAIVNRLSAKAHPQSIGDYFQGGAEDTWQITILELLYCVHILTTFPEYVVISKIRIFQLMEIQPNPKQNISIGEILYMLIVVGICYSFYKFNVTLQVIMDLSGSIIGYMFALVIPTWIHLKCVFYDKSSGFIDGEDDRNMEIVLNDCQCNISYSSKYTLYLETTVLIFCVIFGGFFFMTTLHSQLTN